MSATRKPEQPRSAAGGKAAQGSAIAALPAPVDAAFPPWEQAAAERDVGPGSGLPGTGSAPVEKFEDPGGLALPPATLPFLDAWKRPEDLAQGTPAVPMVLLRPAPGQEGSSGGGEGEKRGGGGGGGGSGWKAGATASAPPNRELDGRLYAGHESFEWLLAVINAVVCAERHFKRGEYLWELIGSTQKDREGLATRSPSGRYVVKLFILDRWRAVTVDDRIPVDLFGRPLLVGARPLQLWPLLLCKAILKVAATYRALHLGLPHEVAAFRMLTGWVQEDLASPLSGVKAEGGALFDRLEDVVGWGGLLLGMPPAAPPLPPQLAPAVGSGGKGAAAAAAAAAAVAAAAAAAPGDGDAVASAAAAGIITCCLAKYSRPARNPPRIIVLCGPGAVGKGALARRLVSEYPDRFGLTVSTTTRPPREHEVDGRDFHFTEKRTLLAGVKARTFLEAARVSPAPRADAGAQPISHWFGTSLASVREVAATGRLCATRLDMQGAQALRSNPRIDGLYIYVSTSDPSVLEARQRARLKEAESTISKRVSWAKAQCTRAAGGQKGVFDHIVPNGDNQEEVYHAVKEAISGLSPIIRNRLRGLPAYVLDYSDLIAPNSVERAFLKPVVLVGPDTGERAALVARLVGEFPEVFGVPRATTTRSEERERRAHVAADGDELGLGDALLQMSFCRRSPRHGAAASSSHGSGSCDGPAGAGEDADAESQQVPEPVVLEEEEFSAAITGGRLFDWHSELFRHPLDTRRAGHAASDVRAVIEAGRLPLMVLEAEGAEALKSKGVDCLTIFLMPPGDAVYEGRVRQWLTETEADIAARQAAAAEELDSARASGVFDAFVENDKLDDGYAAFCAAVSRHRPDVLPPTPPKATGSGSAAGSTAIAQQQPGDLATAAARAKQPAAVPPPVLLLCGPAGAGKEAVAARLLARLPGVFALPQRVTDRKLSGAAAPSAPTSAKGGASAAATRAATPAGGSTSAGGEGAGLYEPGAGVEVMKPDAFARLAASGQLAAQWQDAAGAQFGVTFAALKATAAAGKVAILGLETAEQVVALKQAAAAAGPAGASAAAGPPVTTFAAFVALQASLLPGSPGDTQSGAAEAARGSGAFQSVIIAADAEEGAAELQAALALACPLVPPLLDPLVLVGPFGCGKRGVLGRLSKEMLPGAVVAAPVVTTKERPAAASSSTDGMDVVTPEEAARMTASGELLLSEEVAGHVYGISAPAVHQLVAAGKLVALTVDRVAQATALKAAGFKARYILLQPQSLAALQARLRTSLLAAPPPGHSASAAADAICSCVAEEVAQGEARAAELFDATVPVDVEDLAAATTRLAEVLQRLYPSVVSPQLVWGYGRPLWDPGCRVYGQRPLRVVMLGPAGSGKSTQCELLARRFGAPHVNAGDLLHSEVQRRTPLGIEAQTFMHGNSTVPDRFFLSLLTERLSAPDCAANGWVLDGFPHTRKQVERLAAAGFVPDKAIFLEGVHVLLSERIRHRRIDYTTGRTYHLPPDGPPTTGPGSPAQPPSSGGGGAIAATAAAAMAAAAAAAAAASYSEPVRPLRADGVVDAEVSKRLEVRHDDSPENVARRLALWDVQVEGLREAFEDISLRIPARGGVAQVAAAIASYVTLESRLAGAGSEPSVIQSLQLPERTYRVVGVARHQRRQLLKLQGLEGGSVWVQARELAHNSACLLMHHPPASVPFTRLLHRGDGVRAPREHLVRVTSREPVSLLCSLDMAPQHMPQAVAAAAASAATGAPRGRRIVVLCGPTGSGRATLVRRLLSDYPDKLQAAPRLTSRAPHPLEVLGQSAQPGPSTADGKGAAAAPDAPAPAPRRSDTGSVVGACAPRSAMPLGSLAPGSEFLRFVSDRDMAILQQAGGFAEHGRHLGSACGTPLWALEAAWAQGRVALVVGTLAAGERLKELAAAEVTVVFISASVETLDRRAREMGLLDEGQLERHLMDAQAQVARAESIVAEQQAEQRQRQLDAAAAATAAAAVQPGTTIAGGGATAPLGPSSKLGAPTAPAPTVGGPAAGLGSTAAAPGTPKGTATAAQQGASTARVMLEAAPESAATASLTLDAVVDNSGLLEAAYSHLKHIVSSRWPPCDEHTPGLLLLQRQGPAAHGPGTDPGSAIEPPPPDALTAIRLRAVTAAGAILQLPRGTHTLRVVCSELLPHAVSFACASDFEVFEEGSKPAVMAVPPTPVAAASSGAAGSTAAAAAAATAVVAGGAQMERDHALLPAGSPQLLLRCLLTAAEPCRVGLRLACSTPALAAAARMVAVDNATGAMTTAQLGRIDGLQVEGKGHSYTVVAYARPRQDIRPGTWCLIATVDHTAVSAVAAASGASMPTAAAAPINQGPTTAARTSQAAGATAAGAGSTQAAAGAASAGKQQAAPVALLALQDVPITKMHTFEGVCAPNTQGVLSRFVLAPTSPVCVSMIARAAPLPSLGSSACLRLLDTGSAKEVAWHIQGYTAVAKAEAEVYAEAAGSIVGGAEVHKEAPGTVAGSPGQEPLKTMGSPGSSPVSGGIGGSRGGTAHMVLPSATLVPGRYVAVLETAQDAGSPLPWSLQILVNADEKACPIVRDDAWERHLRLQVDSWQAGAAAFSATVAAAIGAAGVSASTTGSSAGPTPAPAKATPAASQQSAAAAAAARDRTKLAAAALEQHIAASRPTSAVVGAKGLADAPSAAAGPAGSGQQQQPSSAAGRRRGASATLGGSSAQAAPPANAPRGPSRQLKSTGGAGAAPTIVPLAPEAAVVRLSAAPAAASPSQPKATGQPPQQDLHLVSIAEQPPAWDARAAAAVTDAGRAEVAGLASRQASELAALRTARQQAQQQAALAVLGLVAQQQQGHAQAPVVAAAAADKAAHGKGAAGGGSKSGQAGRRSSIKAGK